MDCTERSAKAFLKSSQKEDAVAANHVAAADSARDLARDAMLSLKPQSVPAPFAMGTADKIGAVPSLAAVFAVVTELIGALSGKALFAGIGRDPLGWMARGFAMGMSAHGIGAARALQVNADAGAWAAVA